MSSVDIEQLFDTNRFPDGLLLLPICLYFPLGLFLVLIRFFIGLHAYLVAFFLPKTASVRSLLLRAMCFVLGLVVHEGDTKHKNGSAKVVVTNHITILDHLAVDIVLPSTMPCTSGLPRLLTWCLGYKDLGEKNGPEVLISNVRRHCRESDLPVLVYPEGANTNGRVGLLKFTEWPFCIGEPITPVALEVRRFHLLNVAPSVIGSHWWSDLFWFLFSPCTIFTLRYLPEVRRNESISEKEFASEVSRLVATTLRIQPTDFTSADKAEYLKRLQHRPVVPVSRTVRRPEVGTVLTVMAQQVKEVLPNVPLDAIRRDLVRTNSVSLTISNILEGTVHFVPEEDSATSPSSTNRTSSSAPFSPGTASSGTSLDATCAGLNTAALSFGRTASERMSSYQDRKRKLIEAARRRYVDKHTALSS